MATKTCPACNGSTNCAKCSGTGTRPSPSLLSLSNVKCAKCNGTGNCTRCRGNGVVPDR